MDFIARIREVETLVEARDEVHVAANTAAQMFWLTNRKPETWKYLQTFHGQPTKKVFLPLEVGLECGDKQALAEPARTAEEIDPVGMCQSINQLGLVYIHTIIVA